MKNTITFSSLNNLEEEDIRSYFDNIQTNEELELQDDFSEYEFSEDDYEDMNICIASNINNIANSKTYWFCRMLMLWQYVYYISDTALGFLLKIVLVFLKIFSSTSDQISQVCTIFPQNLYMMSKMLKNDNLDFQEFTVCIKCFALYDFNDCFNIVEGVKVTRHCSFVAFPNHRNVHRRTSCNQPLLMEVENSFSKKLIPYKTFCYKSIKSSLQVFVKQASFEDLCEKWRSREVKPGILQDVYDGRIWNEFNGGKYDFF